MRRLILNAIIPIQITIVAVAFCIGAAGFGMVVAGGPAAHPGGGRIVASQPPAADPFGGGEWG